MYSISCPVNTFSIMNYNTCSYRKNPKNKRLEVLYMLLTKGKYILCTDLSRSCQAQTFVHMVASNYRIKPELHFISLKWVW